jgi:Haem-degrading
MAKSIAENALADCKARGYEVSVVVVDRGGDTVVALRADDARPHTMENARRKAYTARTFRMTTEEFVIRWRSQSSAMKRQPRSRPSSRNFDAVLAGKVQLSPQEQAGYDPPGVIEPATPPSTARQVPGAVHLAPRNKWVRNESLRRQPRTANELAEAA